MNYFHPADICIAIVAAVTAVAAVLGAFPAAL